MKKIFSILGFMLLSTMLVVAQSINMPSGNGTAEESTCSGTFYDSGGANGNHAANSASSILLVPADGGAISLAFTLFDLGEGATLTLYDGDDNTAPIIMTYEANIAPSEFPIVATNPEGDGCIFIEFTSGAATAQGWAATVDCREPCQPIVLSLNSDAMDALITFEYDSAEGGDLMYVNVCKDDEVTFSASLEFPLNNEYYTQTEENTTISWRFGYDAIITEPEVARVFDEVKGWDFTVYAEDDNACYSNMLKGRIRVAENPIDRTLPLRTICEGDEYVIRVGDDALAEIQTKPIESKVEAVLNRADTVFLPDGSNVCYESELIYDIFGATQTLESMVDFLGVSLWLEHSYLGDLSIRLRCPNGQQTALKAYSTGNVSLGYTPTGTITNSCSSNGGSTHLGQAPDPGSGDPCYLAEGVPYKYTFKPGAPACFGTGGQAPPYNLGAPCPNSGNSLTASPDSLHQPGTFYGPYETFTNLIGCPLNGPWTIVVCDHLYSDNGYIFGWEIALNPEIIPGNWEYEVGLDSVIWEGPGASSVTALSGLINPDTSGSLGYTYTIIDEYGCQYTDDFDLEVVAAPIPDIILDEDTVRICTGEEVVLDANYAPPGIEVEYLWNNGSEATSILAFYEGHYSVSCYATSEDATLTCKGTDSVYLLLEEFPIPDFEADTTGGCIPLTIQMTNNTTPIDSNTKFNWRLYSIDGNILYHSTEAEPEFFIELADTIHVQLLVETAAGCKDSIMKWNYIVSNEQPIVEFIATPEISLLSETGGAIKFMNYTDSTRFAQRPDNRWYWDFGDGVVDSTTTIDEGGWSPEHIYDTWGDYEVTLHVTTSAGCSGEVKHNIIIEEDIVFPNVITPNNDGMNDVFALVNFNPDIDPEDPEQHRQNKLIIHNRWGKKVYEAENYDTYIKDGELFVGTQAFTGEGCSDGQYYFTFTYKGWAKTIVHNGSIMIFRDSSKGE